MGINLYRTKISLYIFVIIMVGTLFSMRLYNAWQKANYITELVFENGDTKISLHHPNKILSAKNDASYPLIFSFYYTGDIASPHTYEISLESPTLLFVDAEGAETTPRFQFTSDRAFIEQSIYVRPYLSEAYPQNHVINMQVVVDGQVEPNQPTPIEIEVEAEWVSFFSLAATSLLEISIASALVTWAVNALDTALTSRKERVTEIRDKLNDLITLPYLERLEKFIILEEEIKKGNLAGYLRDELQQWQRSFSASENEFMQTVGTLLRQDDLVDNFANIHKWYIRFFTVHKDSLDALAIILSPRAPAQEEILPLILAIIKLWDDFDTNAKDFIIGVLQKLSQRIDLTSLSKDELSNLIFSTPERRRLLRDVEIRMLFSQLSYPPPVYDADWLHLPNYSVNSNVIDWLKQHDLVANPFDIVNFSNYPLYPERFARPDYWEDFIKPLPQHAQCPTSEDAKVLASLLRVECLPLDKEGRFKELGGKSEQQIFPVWVLSEHTVLSELPLITLTRSAAWTWIKILPFSPNAMLDLLPVDQIALLELLCWAFGSNKAVINLLKQANLKEDHAPARLLTKKIGEFKSEILLPSLLQDSILISWLKIRPPDLNYTYLILHLDEFPFNVRNQWLEQLSHLISTLLLNGIVIKAVSHTGLADALLLSNVCLDWSYTRLKASLNTQFEAVMDKKSQYEMGTLVDFQTLFPPGYVGDSKDEGRTIDDKLIFASRNSLWRMFELGNRLLQHHCENRLKDRVPEKYLYVEDLETILNSA